MGIRFKDVAEEGKLVRLAGMCERQYLREIGEVRSVAMSAVAGRGGDVKQAWLDFEQNLCKRDLYYLAKYVLGYDRMTFHLHRFMAMSVDELKPGARELREFPRDAYKTTTMTISFMVQQVLRNPDVRILLKSNAEGNASKKLREAKEHFFADPESTPADRAKALPRLFPELACKTEKEKGADCYWRCPGTKAVQQDGTFAAAGVGSSKVSQHFDIVIGDDFWDEKSVTSLEVATKTEKEMNNLEYLLTSPAQGIIMFVGTRFSHDDPTKQLLESGHYHCVLASGILPNGRSLFPESLTATMYMHQARQSRYVFSCQVMLNPQSGDSDLKVEWFRYLRWADIVAGRRENKLSYRVVLLSDCTVDGKQSSDNVAILAVVIDSLNRKTVVEAVREKMEPSRYIDRVCGMWDKWRPEFVVRQKTALETTVQSFFRERNRKRAEEGKSTVRFYDYSLHKREKKGRITASLQPRMQGGEMYLDPELENLNEILRETSQHPNSRNDDFIDALATLDDQAVSRVPRFNAPVAPEADTYIPTVEHAHRADIAQKHADAKRVFDFYNNKRRVNSRNLAGRMVK